MTKRTKEDFEQLKRSLQKTEKSWLGCPIWPKSPAQLRVISRDPPVDAVWLPRAGGVSAVWSPRAGGVFEMFDNQIFSNHLFYNFFDKEIRKRLSSWIWEKNNAFETLDANEESEIPKITEKLIKDLGKRKPLSVEDRIDRALQAIGRPPKELNADTRAPNDNQALFMAATECNDLGEMIWLLRQLETAGLLTNPKYSDSYYVLTLKGLARLESGGDAEVSKTAFVAMWFNDEVKDAYEKGIAPAIRNARYEPCRIDEVEHSDKIDDRIIAEIRRARFLVCDLTCGLLRDKTADSEKTADSKKTTAIARGSVYYEAGFAHGLNKPVIWTCREDLLEHVHFDINHYNFIKWKKGEEDKLRKKIEDRIGAVIF